jgi:hypothetical protein
MQDLAAHPVPDRAALTAGAVAAGVVGLLLGVALAVGGRLWFFSDDWNILADYHDGGLMEPFNGHLSALPAGIYQGLFHTVGLESYLPYRLCGLLALGVLGFQVARCAIGRVPPVVAVLAVAAVMWNSFGATNVLFPFLMNFSIPIAAMVAIWWHLDHDRRGHDVAAGIWLAVALATSGLGVMTLAAVAVELALRRAPLHRWAVFAPATLAWLWWWLLHRGANEISGDLLAVAEYALRMLWGGTTALAAGNRAGGLVVAVAFAVLTVVALRRGSFGARPVGALAAAAAFVGLTAVTRLDVVPAIPPDELRYGWTIGAYLVLAAVSMWSPAVTAAPPAPAGPSRPRSLATAGAVVVTAVVLLGGWRLVEGMHRWTDQVAGAAPGLRSVLYATEAAGADRVDPEVVLPLSYVPVTTGAYLDAVADVGSPLEGATAAVIGGRGDQRDFAEDLFFDSVELRIESPPTTEEPDRSRCARDLSAEPGEAVSVLPAVEASPGDAELDVARFAERPARRLGDEGLARWVLVLPEDAPVGTDAVVPYVLRTDGTHLLCTP